MRATGFFDEAEQLKNQNLLINKSVAEQSDQPARS